MQMLAASSFWSLKEAACSSLKGWLESQWKHYLEQSIKSLLSGQSTWKEPPKLPVFLAEDHNSNKVHNMLEN